MANAENNEGTPIQGEVSPHEAKAREQGWVPQDEWQGDPEAWRPAKEFLDRGELFRKIDEQSKTIKEFRKALSDLQKHNAKLAEVEYARALETLKKQKKDALIEGDADAVIDIDEKMSMVRDAQKTAAAQPVTQVEPAETVHPVFNAWKERNGWYDTNRAMRAFADRVGAEAAARGASVTDVLTLVEQEVKKEFAEKFTNPNRNKPGAVEGSAQKGSSKADKFELSSEERRIAERIIRATPGMTMEKYVADLKAIKGV